ncbi:hypothetical protein [Lysinibacillus sp. NPDC093688]|uniref:hypothetical protein n=1 Tax=Lysinibacillus sp. NPDC093688 TaxID=3390577 RepID=UPI003CFEED3A
MNKRFTFTVLLAIVFALTSLLLYAHVKTQGEEIWNYKYDFFLGTGDLIDNYQFILDFEKSYLTEKDIDKKEQMVENHANLLYLLDNHADTESALLYKQVNVDVFIELNSNVLIEALAFQSSSSDNERQTHVEKLEVAIARFKKFIDDGMKANNVCISESCME